MEFEGHGCGWLLTKVKETNGSVVLLRVEALKELSRDRELQNGSSLAVFIFEFRAFICLSVSSKPTTEYRGHTGFSLLFVFFPLCSALFFKFTAYSL